MSVNKLRAINVSEKCCDDIVGMCDVLTQKLNNLPTLTADLRIFLGSQIN